MRVLLSVCAVIVALSAAYAAGEYHRRGCVSEGMVSCSVLPWDNGAGVPSPSITVDTVCTKEDRIDNALDDTPHARGC